MKLGLGLSLEKQNVLSLSSVALPLLTTNNTILTTNTTYLTTATTL